MKRSYFLRQFWFLPGVLVGMVLLFASAASAQTPSIEGTYQLMSRKLPDGTVLKPPDIMGLQTYTKSHRNFNLVLKDATTGKFSSNLRRGHLQADGHEYSQTRLFSIVNDQIGGRELLGFFSLFRTRPFCADHEHA